MDKLEVEYQLLLDYLIEVDTLFPVSLSEKVVLKEYAQKLCTKATLCIEKSNHQYVGVVAGYTENIENDLAYISLVGVRPKYSGKGIASKLIKEFLNICKSKQIRKAHVYTDARNKKAIAMYEKLGFERYYPPNETRPEDVHFIISI